MPSQEVVVAVTGASGSIYAIRLIEVLLAADRRVHLVISGAARLVLQRELQAEFPADGADEADWHDSITGMLTGRIAEQWGFPPAPTLEVNSGRTGRLRVHGIAQDQGATYLRPVSWL